MVFLPCSDIDPQVDQSIYGKSFKFIWVYFLRGNVNSFRNFYGVYEAFVYGDIGSLHSFFSLITIPVYLYFKGR